MSLEELYPGMQPKLFVMKKVMEVPALVAVETSNGYEWAVVATETLEIPELGYVIIPEFNCNIMNELLENAIIMEDSPCDRCKDQIACDTCEGCDRCPLIDEALDDTEHEHNNTHEACIHVTEHPNGEITVAIEIANVRVLDLFKKILEE